MPASRENEIGIKGEQVRDPARGDIGAIGIRRFDEPDEQHRERTLLDASAPQIHGDDVGNEVIIHICNCVLIGQARFMPAKSG